MYASNELHARDVSKRRAQRSALVAAIAALAFAATAAAAPVAVPNGDFSSSADNGHVGGGALGGSGSALVGTGPWSGSYQGILFLLAPPLLTIGSGHASISGLAGLNAGTIVDNFGYFSQTLPTAFVANHHYLLSANIDAGVPLNVGVLNSGNAGIALTQGSNVLASSTGSAPADVTLSLLSGTAYKLVLAYDTGASVSGSIGLRLFSAPQNLLTVNLLTSVSFSDVTLSSGQLNPVAASIAPASGTPQGAQVNTSFAAPFSVTVLDAENDPVAGVNVTFTVPSSGPSVGLSATTVVTDASGTAKVTGIANGSAGGYVITAKVDNVVSDAQFQLTNIAGGASAVGSATGTPQSAMVNTSFASSLGATVTDAGGNAVSGITVTFTAPGTGASVSFRSGNSATTDVSGHASVAVSANTVAGDYVVTASVAGGTSQANYSLANTAGTAAIATPLGGTPQTAMVSTPFAIPLSLKLTDAFGNAVAATAVTFTAPGSAASATFPPDGNVTIVQTDAQGVATIDAIANATTGSYTVAATSTGLETSAAFSLANSEQSAPVSVITSGGDQSANAQAAFVCMLQLRVTDQNNIAMSGASIDFTAPANGPSAVLSNGLDSGALVTVITDNDGLAGVTATANAIPGIYDIAASMHGTNTALASYTLTNLDIADDLFLSNFENAPALCPNR